MKLRCLSKLKIWLNDIRIDLGLSDTDKVNFKHFITNGKFAELVNKAMFNYFKIIVLCNEHKYI